MGPSSSVHSSLFFPTQVVPFAVMVHFCTFSAAAALLVAAATAAAQGSSYTVPFASGSGDWAAAYKKAKAVVWVVSGLLRK